MTTQQKTTGLYAAFGLCVLMTCLPNMTLQNYAALLSLAALIAAYVLRSKSAEDSLEAHHATFVIRTIWIWSALLVLGMMGAGIMISQSGDMTALDTLLEDAMNGAQPSEESLDQATANYFNTNYALILKTTILWLTPAQTYAAWRIARGLPRAIKGYRLPNVRAWF